MTEVYTKEASEATRTERRGIYRRTVISEAKAKVKTLDLARRLCGYGRLRGDEWEALCPLPDHKEKTPSFSVNLQKNVWCCLGCGRGGDVIELARHVWGYEKAEVQMAAADLLWEFGHPRPDRPRSWFARQERQAPVRDAIEEAKISHLQWRVFRRFEPLLESIEDDQERNEEAAVLWEAAGEISVLIWAGRRSA